MQPVTPITFSLSEGDSEIAVNAVPARMSEAAFSALYRETGPLLRAYLRRASGNAALADDLLQETFYRFLRAGPPQLEAPQTKAYLYRTAMSLLTDHWRRQKRERQWSLRSIFRNRGTREAEDVGHDMERLFRRLKPQEQMLLWLAYVEGFDHAEIASALSLKEKSVRVLLFRARSRIAAILTKEGLAPGKGK